MNEINSFSMANLKELNAIYIYNYIHVYRVVNTYIFHEHNLHRITLEQINIHIIYTLQCHINSANNIDLVTSL